nr:serine carboxypeptidase-like 10 isoform X1 [Arachis hypogaea]
MGWRCWCVVLVVVVVFQPVIDSASASSIVKNLPGYDGYLPFNLETGYVGVGEDEAVQLFYLFVESERNPLFDPLLLWFVGGPGCSALSAFFFENGPLRMDQNFSGNIPKLELNPYSWTHMLSMLYIDIPVGTGFSYSKTQQGYYSSDTLWVEHTYAFLQKWFIDHPKFNSNPFYVGGGSYSGYPTAPLVQKLYDGYVAGRVPRINIKGYVIASPGVDAYESENTKVLYAYQMSLIPESLYQSIKEHCGGNYVNIDPEDTKCVSDYEAYSELMDLQLVRYINPQQILEPLCETTPGVNHGILQSSLQHRSEFWCRSYSHILVNTWANDESVRKALYIREGTKGEFLRCNKTLAYNVTLLSVAGYYQNLTKANIQALVYCSDLDMSIPHIATQNWIKSLKLSIYDKWRAWFVDGQVAGFTEIYKMKEDHYLTYVSVKGAGHVAQTFKPKEVYHMIKRWFSYSLI